MLKHSLVMIYRGFIRSRNYFLINLFGLTAGITSTLLIMLWVVDELRMDKFHSNGPQLFQVMRHVKLSDGISTTFNVQGILANALKQEIPEIRAAATVTFNHQLMFSYKDNLVRAKGTYADTAFFQVFSFPLLRGNVYDVLKDKSSIVISESLAQKLFPPGEDPMGKEIQIQNDELYVVTGVFKDYPAQSTLQHEFVLPFEKFLADNPWANNWNNNGPTAYVLLHPDANVLDVNKKIARFLDNKVEDSRATLFLQPLSERYLYGTYTNGAQDGGRINYVRTFTIVAILILLIACINFMNLSTARASRKAKEFGVKKTLGALRGMLMKQILLESTVMSGLSVLLALAMTALLLPTFNVITDKRLVLDLADGTIMLFLFATIIVTGLLAGSYPAFYLSSFNPAEVIKGEIKGTFGEFITRKGLVVFQFALSGILIVSMVVIYRQLEYFQNKSLGYDKDRLVRIFIEGTLEKKLETFVAELRGINGVTMASAIGHNLNGRNNNTDGVDWSGKNNEDPVLFECIHAAYNLEKTLGLELKEGRFFSESFPADTTGVIFNEAAIEVMGLSDPVGKTVKLWDTPHRIIGIVKNFHFQSLRETVNPLFIDLKPSGAWNVMVRIEPGKEKDVLADIAKVYKEINPGFVFEPRFQSEEYEKQYKSEQRVSSLSFYFSFIAIIISCLGLFGLTTFSIERRLKEIGIRKALGCSSTSVVLLLTKDLTKLVVIGIAIGFPISYWLLSSWLGNYQYHIDLSFNYFLGAALVTILIAWLTVGWQAVKASNISPVNCLKEL